MATPDDAAFDAAAPLVECAENTETSTPASQSWSLIQRPIVAPVTGLWGFEDATNKVPELATERILDVASR